ncbi:MAG: CrcB family protein [Puniceicoccaceae bacterium]|nr:MAG: CrcB family protein [Puniceicoccaceae bacterium]
MKRLFWIGLGSGLGGSLRYLIDLLVAGVAGLPPVLATFFINITGSLLVGYLAGLWARQGVAQTQLDRWHFWVTGFCGGYTTFSIFSWQVLALVEAGEGTLAGAYAAGSLGIGLIAVYIGLSLAVRRQAVHSTQSEPPASKS